MQLSYFHVADDVPCENLPEAAVVIDVLRATTSIAYALQNGAESVIAFENLEDLRIEASKWPAADRLLLGERGGKRVDDFDLGNSPVALVPEIVSGKRIFMSTTNGTRSLDRVREVRRLFTLALPNRRAVAMQLIKENPSEVWIVGSGWQGDYSLEDSLGAGSLAALLLEELDDVIQLANDEITAALAVWESWKLNLEGCLRKASHGQRLVKLGNHDEDFQCCAGLDQLDVVPSQVEEGVLRAL